MNLPSPDLPLHVLLILSLLGALTLWMKSDLPILPTRLARVLGLRKGDKAFWPDDIEYKFWIRTQWAKWLHQRCKGTAPGRAVAHLLSCPYCLGFHLSWITGVILLFTPASDQALYCAAYPAVLYVLYKFT